MVEKNTSLMLFEDVMPEWLWDSIEEEFDDFEKKNIWKPYASRKVDGLTSNAEAMSGLTAGQCLATPVSLETKNILGELLKDYFPAESVDFSVRYHINFPYSQLQPHNDSNNGWFATIYLMREWKSSWGGLFLWTPENWKKGNWLAITPQGNQLVVGNNKPPIRHMMTMIQPFARVKRRSIQIWGKYEN